MSSSNVALQTAIMQAGHDWFVERKLAPVPDIMVRMVELTLKLARERADEQKREAFERLNGIGEPEPLRRPVEAQDEVFR